MIKMSLIAVKPRNPQTLTTWITNVQSIHGIKIYVTVEGDSGGNDAAQYDSIALFIAIPVATAKNFLLKTIFFSFYFIPCYPINSILNISIYT